jgi:maltose O-acetyltransferase
LWDCLVNGIVASYICPLTLRRYILTALGCKYSKKSTIHGHCYIGSRKLIIGDGSYLNRGCWIDNIQEHVIIGNNCSIGYKVMFLTTNHDSSNYMKRGGPVKASPIVVEHGVWIGAGAVILPGVVIKQGAIIASGAVVTKECEANCIYAGVPAKKIKEL